MARQPADPSKPRRVQGPRPAYVMLKGEGAKQFANAIADGSLEIVHTARKADEVLEGIANGRADAYIRFEVK